MDELIDIIVVLVVLCIVASLMHTIWMIRLWYIGTFRSKWMLAEAIHSWRTGADTEDDGFVDRRVAMNSGWLIVKPLVYRWIIGTPATLMLLLHSDTRLIAELNTILTECPELHAALYKLHIDALPELFRIN